MYHLNLEEQNQDFKAELEKQHQQILATLPEDVRKALEILRTNFEEEVRQNPQDAISAYETYESNVQSLLKYHSKD
jgi:hypothetical protein